VGVITDRKSELGAFKNSVAEDLSAVEQYDLGKLDVGVMSAGQTPLSPQGMENGAQKHHPGRRLAVEMIETM